MSFAARTAPIALLVLLVIPSASAQPAARTVSGHWEGAIQVPDNELKIEVDLATNEKGIWIGTISIPQQGTKGYPVANITVQGDSVSFLMKGGPGDPTFQGTLSTDGKSIAGTLTQGGGSVAFKMTRTGDAKIEPVAKSAPITKDLEGTWEGALDVNGKQLRLILKMSNQPDGASGGSVVSVDQGGAEIPITTITQRESNLKFEIKPIGGSYTGDLNKEKTELVGQWTQGAGSLPLTFKRPAKK